VLATTKSLQQFPDIGRMVPELDNQQVRERFVYSCRVPYKIEPKRVLVVAILHEKRLLGDVGDRMS
jgi:toxin ParE1/3/4